MIICTYMLKEGEDIDHIQSQGRSLSRFASSYWALMSPLCVAMCSFMKRAFSSGCPCICARIACPANDSDWTTYRTPASYMTRASRLLSARHRKGTSCALSSAARMQSDSVVPCWQEMTSDAWCRP